MFYISKLEKKTKKQKNKMVWDSGEVGNSIVADPLESADTRRKMTCCSAALF
jgi:hypothetical protein